MMINCPGCGREYEPGDHWKAVPHRWLTDAPELYYQKYNDVMGGFQCPACHWWIERAQLERRGLKTPIHILPPPPPPPRGERLL